MKINFNYTDLKRRDLDKIIQTIKDLDEPLVLSVANQKGGVGKTATVDNVGEILASLGLMTGLIDNDAQSSITNLKYDITKIINEHLPEMSDVMLEEVSLEDIKVKIKDNLYLFPTTLRLSETELNLTNATLRELILKKAIESLDTKFDIILIDCPPSRGLLTVNALSASDYILIPVQSEYQALVSIQLLFTTIRKVQQAINPNLKELGYVITMATPTNHSDEIIEQVTSDEKADIIGLINRGIAISDAGVANMSSYEYDKTSTPGKQYYNLTLHMLKRIFDNLTENGGTK
ncbi:ParA family protein (plasmid) [Carnobacterium maltaromaticum]|uniref:ParA family protein n=1 Tax=Carnobacterium maltaromaticum TaxID=2751 RepID=UPI00344FB5CA